jgi:Domain of unknown function (DUF4190)
MDAAVCMKCGHQFSTVFQQPQPAPPNQTQAFFTAPAPQYQAQGSAGFGIAALVLGIISVVFMCLWLISIPCAILAIIFGFVGRDSQGKGMAIAGLVCGILGIAFNLLWIFIFAASLAAAGPAK